MTNIFNYLHVTVFWIVVICWLFFGFAFLFQQEPVRREVLSAKPRAILGIILQMLGLALVWGVRRPMDVSDVSISLEIAVSIFTIALTFGSIWIVLSAVRTLGIQWTLKPKVAEDHILITTGPYALVRHPFYTGMLGLLIATGMALSYINVLVLAVLLYLLGFYIRMRDEEKTLRQVFGPEFDDYSRNVPAIFPRFSA